MATGMIRVAAAATLYFLLHSLLANEAAKAFAPRLVGRAAADAASGGTGAV